MRDVTDANDGVSGLERGQRGQEGGHGQVGAHARHRFIRTAIKRKRVFLEHGEIDRCEQRLGQRCVLVVENVQPCGVVGAAWRHSIRCKGR